MDRRWEIVVRNCLPDLVELLRPSVLSCRLYSTKLLTKDETQKIDKMTDAAASKLLLIHILPKKGPHAYDTFVDVVRKTEGQSHIAEKFLTPPTDTEDDAMETNDRETDVEVVINSNKFKELEMKLMAERLVNYALHNDRLRCHHHQGLSQVRYPLPLTWKQWPIELPSDKFLRGQVATTENQLVVGGFNGNVYLRSLHAQHPEWKSITRQAADILALDCQSNECFAMIYDKLTGHSAIESFDPGRLTGWCPVADLPDEFQSLSDVAMVVHNQFLFAIGGRTRSGKCVSTVCVRNLRLTSRSAPFTTLPDMITGRSSCSAVVIGDTLFIGGGRDSEGGFSNEVEALNIDRPNGRWQKVSPTTRYDPTLVQFSGKLLALGGLTGKTWSHSPTVTSSAELFDDSVSRTWLPLPDMNNRWMSHGAAACGNLLIVAGGLSSARYVIESTKLISYNDYPV